MTTREQRDKVDATVLHEHKHKFLSEHGWRQCIGENGEWLAVIISVCACGKHKRKVATPHRYGDTYKVHTECKYFVLQCA